MRREHLLRIAAGLIRADDGGRVELLGQEQVEPSPDVGVVFPIHNMLPWLSVEANIRLLAEVRGISDVEITARVEPMLKVLRLEKFPPELSS